MSWNESFDVNRSVRRQDVGSPFGSDSPVSSPSFREASVTPCRVFAA
jgi:hypothetical protein